MRTFPDLPVFILSSLVSALSRRRTINCIWELTYRCNLDCAFCYNDIDLEGVPMTTEEFSRFFEDLRDMQVLNLALSYGGRGEIVDGVNRMIADAKKGLLPDKITEEHLESYLYTAGLPDPDLLIRTGGEMRISNFLLWQLAYGELWITDLMWPDFRKVHLLRAIRDYQKRERRFGRVD